ncbi:alpha/beta fold hydrolase [Chelatococcus asaccharovorans]|uniref:3-oxoadipate enol-lactonase n=1 Tax=Chelatococcus asaccharovorans TaxID=28210 RepID=A0A2V3TXQ2_9HYPH|nr:alpha/beta hydrolase [Chelatococcus asaccharovorans]MBS7707500.1 alpha/beta fold hydrolase [Chelatococcus asaccharovorans]PXW54180.1 3-oxoadipate enol-lactonase [Chelatococcus asaccharovorans]
MADWIETNGTILRVAVEGEGPPLVLVHEIGGTLESYDAVVPALARTHRVVRYDMRGCGLSEFNVAPITLPLLVNDLLGILDAYDLRRVSVAGCAAGAAVAIGLALDHPARVHKVVAMSPALQVPPEKKAAVLARADAFEGEGLRPTQDARMASSYPEALRGDRARFDRIRRQRLAANPYGIAGLLRMLARLDMTRRLPELRHPMLVMAGIHDGDRPPQVVKPIADAVPGARYMEIESGHFMPMQTPDAIIAALTDFLSPTS